MARVPLSPAARDRALWLQKLAAERDALQRELEELKKKFEGVRSRNKVLSSEVKTLRSQMGTLVEKGRHDDELIDALMVQPPLGPLPHPEACDPAPAPPEPSLTPKCHLHNPGAHCLHWAQPRSLAASTGATQRLPKGQYRSCYVRLMRGTRHCTCGPQRRKKRMRGQQMGLHPGIFLMEERKGQRRGALVHILVCVTAYSTPASGHVGCGL